MLNLPKHNLAIRNADSSYVRFSTLLISILVFAAVIFLPVRAHAQAENLIRDLFVPKAGFVPDALTAETIADAVLAPIYGYHELRAEKPYKINLVNEVWIVEGTLHGNEVGEVIELWISKTDGAILHLSLK